MKKAILLLLVLSLSFAGEVWKVDTGAGVGNQPLVYGSRVIVGTSAGKVYSIEPPFIKWSYNAIDPIITEPASFGDKVIVATADKVIALNQFGALQWETELPGVRGVAVSDKVYVADDNGIQALNSDGTVAWNFKPGMEDVLLAQTALEYSITKPLATPNYVIFGYNDMIYVVRTSGAFFWKQQVGRTWDTPPMLLANTLYVGSAEGILYGLDMFNGIIKSRTHVLEQISTTPLEHQGKVIVGTSENSVHAISDNRIEWTAEVDGKVSRKMFLSASATGATLYVTTTRSLYAIDPSDGAILFKKSFLDWPSPPTYLNGQIIVGTEEGRVYGVDSSKACSILSPEMDAQIGDADLTVTGLSYSRYGAATTRLRVNQGEWINLNGTTWTYNFNPSDYEYGVLELECMVSDSAGSETEPYTMLALVHIGETTPGLFTVTYPFSVKADTDFEITVVDSRGLPLSGTKITASGQTFTGEGTITVSLPPGLHTVRVERAGYQTEEFTIDSKDEPVLAYAAAGIFVLALILYVYFLFIKKEEKKELIIKEKH